MSGSGLFGFFRRARRRYSTGHSGARMMAPSWHRPNPQALVDFELHSLVFGLCRSPTILRVISISAMFSPSSGKPPVVWRGPMSVIHRAPLLQQFPRPTLLGRPRRVCCGSALHRAPSTSRSRCRPSLYPGAEILLVYDRHSMAAAELAVSGRAILLPFVQTPDLAFSASVGRWWENMSVRSVLAPSPRRQRRCRSSAKACGVLASSVAERFESRRAVGRADPVRCSGPFAARIPRTGVRGATTACRWCCRVCTLLVPRSVSRNSTIADALSSRKRGWPYVAGRCTPPAAKADGRQACK